MLRKILLIDADSKIPNIALMKLSSWHKKNGNEVSFVKLGMPYYPSRIKRHYYAPDGFDEILCSVVFEGNLKYIHGDGITFGGTGFDLKTVLPDEIESSDLDYSLYPENDTSYGFITRGCIRNCPFCYVPKKEGKIRPVGSIESIVKHKKVVFLDNNILAYDGHLEVLRKLGHIGIRCQFNQGLDIRLLTQENSEALSRLNYIGEFVFAFDDFSYKNIVSEKLKLLSWRKDWQIKFFIYISPEMKISETIYRIEWCRENKCLPYIMRDIRCFNDGRRDFYTDLAAYCNQPGFFKNMDFDAFLHKRHVKFARILSSLNEWNNAKIPTD